MIGIWFFLAILTVPLIAVVIGIALERRGEPPADVSVQRGPRCPNCGGRM